MERGKGTALGSERHNIPIDCWLLSNINLLPPPPRHQKIVALREMERHREANSETAFLQTPPCKATWRTGPWLPLSAAPALVLLLSSILKLNCIKLSCLRNRYFLSQIASLVWSTFQPRALWTRYKENTAASFSISASLSLPSDCSLVKHWEIPQRAKDEEAVL